MLWFRRNYQLKLQLKLILKLVNRKRLISRIINYYLSWCMQKQPVTFKKTCYPPPVTLLNPPDPHASCNYRTMFMKAVPLTMYTVHS
jgi:hypothetical protein